MFWKRKIFGAFILSTLVLLCGAQSSFASSSGGGSSSSGGDPGPGFFGNVANGAAATFNTIKETPGVLLPWMSQSEFRICQVRRLFCGTTGMVMVAFAIFCIGMLVIMQKLHWLVAIMLITGIIVFADARRVAQTFGSNTFVFFFVDNPMCDCRCSIPLEDIFTNPSSVAQQVRDCATALGYGVNINEWGTK